MHDLYILTAAICRPALHSECLLSFSEDLRSQGIKARWFINIDPALGDQTETYENFKSITNNIDCVINQPSKPCFFTAANTLINQCYNNINNLNDKGYVFWLEDDKNHDISFNIQELIDSDYDYIGFHIERQKFA